MDDTIGKHKLHSLWLRNKFLNWILNSKNYTIYLTCIASYPQTQWFKTTTTNYFMRLHHSLLADPLCPSTNEPLHRATTWYNRYLNPRWAIPEKEHLRQRSQSSSNLAERWFPITLATFYKTEANQQAESSQCKRPHMGVNIPAYGD